MILLLGAGPGARGWIKEYFGTIEEAVEAADSKNYTVFYVYKNNKILYYSGGNRCLSRIS